MSIGSRSRTPGFSLIEVLVAVVVLSVGLLALASLQSTLIKASAESKSQSAALSLAKDAIEQVRSYNASSDYLAIDSVAQGSAATVDLGDTVYSVWREVSRYVYKKDATPPAFQLVSGNTTALGASYEAANEFKVVRVHVDWADATGAAQRITLEDAIGASPPENSARVTRKRLDNSNRKPRVVISDPSLEAGVIPIAIGDGSETAATNPRPTVVGTHGTAIKETTYDIFTYAALTGGTAQAQSRVETAIVGCRCNTSDKVTGSTAYRPTFWDGNRYTVPKEAPYTAPSGEKSTFRGDQSDLCDVCCRDHFDDLTGTDGAKFSPRRTSGHTHFLGGAGTAVSSGDYDEACRVIRVDGFFRVATDPYNEYFNLLETENSFEDSPPDDVATESYKTFVINYLNSQFTNRSSGYNTSLTQEAGDTLAASLMVDNLDLEQYDSRWLHSRGLYVDFLEGSAISAINNAKSDCPSSLTTSECVLRVLPFTSINLAEVSNWKPDTASRIVGADVVNDFEVLAVSNSDFVNALTSGDPVRGNVLTKGAGVTKASALVRTSNTGLLGDGAYNINPDEASPEEAAQQITVSGPACGGSSGEPHSIGSGDAVTSQDTCDSIDGASSIFVRFRVLSDGDGSFALKIRSPSGTDYTVATVTLNADEAFTGEYLPVGAVYEAGEWTASVVRSSNPARAVSFSWSMEPAAAVYSVTLSGYPFASASTSYPGLSATPHAVCNWASGGNPATCSATDANVATELRVGSYNYSVGTTSYSGSFSCSQGTTTNTCTLSSKTGPVCKNFQVSSATNGTVVGSVGTPVGEGTTAEVTPISFASVGNGDAISIVFAAQTNTTPTCTSTGNTSTFCNAGKLTLSCP